MWSDSLDVCDSGFILSALWCPLTGPPVLLGFLLLWMWGISSRLLQQSAASAPYLGWGVSSYHHSSWPSMLDSSSRPYCTHAARSCDLIVSYFGSFGILCSISCYSGKWKLILLTYMLSFITAVDLNIQHNISRISIQWTLWHNSPAHRREWSCPICHSQGNSKYSANKGKKLRMGMWKVLNSLFSSPVTASQLCVGEDSWESLGLQGGPTSPF